MPGRHDTVIHAIHEQRGGSLGVSTQGFITEKGFFVDRREAAQIAFELGQIKKPTSTLFSEDIF